MALLNSLINPPKLYPLEKSGIASALQGKEEYKTIPELIAEQNLRDIREQVRVKMLRYRVQEPIIECIPKPERNTVHFLGVHKPRPSKTTVFDNAARQPIRSLKPVGKIPEYRKFQSNLMAVRKAHNGEE